MLVGFHTSDDAGVYRLNDEQALVTTADIITPPVNDPGQFGQIAAANAISDVYAMGGRPITCLNLVMFPSGKLPDDYLRQMVAGALVTIEASGAVLAGGHTIDDDEPKFGLAVSGLVHPQRFWTNAGARPGDALILTKPLGSGVLFNANIKGWVSQKALSSCIEILTTLNRAASEVLGQYDVHAATDITGFGLAGHGLEMALASDVCLQIAIDRLPVMDESVEMYRRGMTTGVNASIQAMVKDATRFDTRADVHQREMVYDPQTSGGLMVALPADQAEAALSDLAAAGVTHHRQIGRVIATPSDQMRLIFV